MAHVAYPDPSPVVERFDQDAPRRRWPVLLVGSSFFVSWILIYIVMYVN